MTREKDRLIEVTHYHPSIEMKTNTTLTLFATSLIALTLPATAADLSAGWTEAAPTPSPVSSRQMVSTLKGASYSTNSAGATNRTVQLDSKAMPKGHQNHSSSRSGSSLSYKVDTSSQLSTSSVQFRKGSTEIADSASFQYLQNLAYALQDPALMGFNFVVEGHASADGSDYSNMILSQRRANAIFDYLVSRGVAPHRLLSVGHGENFARFRSGDPEYLRAQDRKVVVFKLAN